MCVCFTGLIILACRNMPDLDLGNTRCHSKTYGLPQAHTQKPGSALKDVWHLPNSNFIIILSHPIQCYITPLSSYSMTKTSEKQTTFLQDLFHSKLPGHTVLAIIPYKMNKNVFREHIKNYYTRSLVVLPTNSKDYVTVHLTRNNMNQTLKSFLEHQLMNYTNACQFQPGKISEENT